MSELVQRRKAMAEEMMRDAICDAATAVLGQVGFAALTMERVADAAGVSKGTLYNYYQDKDALVQEVIDRAFADVAAAVDRVLAGPGEASAKLVAIVRVLVTGIEERRALGRAVCSSQLPPLLDANLRAKQLRMRERLVELCRQAQAACVSPVEGGAAEAQGRVLALVLDGLIDERMLHSDECPGVEDDVALIERLVLRPWFREAR